MWETLIFAFHPSCAQSLYIILDLNELIAHDLHNDCNTNVLSGIILTLNINPREDISPKKPDFFVDHRVHLYLTSPHNDCNCNSWYRVHSIHPCKSNTIRDGTCDRSCDYIHRFSQSLSGTTAVTLATMLRYYWESIPTLGHSFVFALIQLAVSLSSSHFFTQRFVTPHKAGLWSPLKLQPKQLTCPHLQSTIGI